VRQSTARASNGDVLGSSCVKVQDSVELPDPVTLVGDTLQEAVVLVARATTPAKPFRPVTVTHRRPAALTFTLTLNGLAAIVKSWTTKVTVTERDSEPLRASNSDMDRRDRDEVQDSVAPPETSYTRRSNRTRSCCWLSDRQLHRSR